MQYTLSLCIAYATLREGGSTIVVFPLCIYVLAQRVEIVDPLISLLCRCGKEANHVYRVAIGTQRETESML
jgi:hypothetical protein